MFMARKRVRKEQAAFLDPFGVGSFSIVFSGGGTSFNPRLISAYPPGWAAGSRAVGADSRILEG